MSDDSNDDLAFRLEYTSGDALLPLRDHERADLREAATRLRATAGHPPAGWRLMPTEPTAKMDEAVTDAIAMRTSIVQDSVEFEEGISRPILKAALAASPSPLEDDELVTGLAVSWAESEGIPWANRTERQRVRLLKGARAVLAYLSPVKEG